MLGKVKLKFGYKSFYKIIIILFFVFCGGLMFLLYPNLTLKVPVPTIVQQLEATGTSTTTEVTLVKSHIPFTQNFSDLSPELLDAVNEYQKKFTLLVENIDLFEKEKYERPFSESDNILEKMKQKLSDCDYEYKVEWKKLGGDLNHPVRGLINRQYRDFYFYLFKAKRENFVRHKKWKEAALYSQEWDWYEGVYYWRQEGGLESLWNVGAGGFEKKLKDKRRLKIIYPLLPYPKGGDVIK